MTWINASLAILVTLGLTASALGYRHSLTRWDGSAEFWFAAAKVLYSLGFGFLLTLWGAVWGIVRIFNADRARLMLDAAAAPIANALGMLVVLAGVYASLKARQLLIPEDERGDWPWWRSWAHPAFWRVRRRHR